MRVVLNLALWLAVGAGAYFLLTALALALTWGFEALPFTFGSRSRSWHLTRTVVSMTPLYARNVEFKAYAGTALLLHSFYSSPSVQADVVGWLARRLGLRSAGPAKASDGQESEAQPRPPPGRVDVGSGQRESDPS